MANEKKRQTRTDRFVSDDFTVEKKDGTVIHYKNGKQTVVKKGKK